MLNLAVSRVIFDEGWEDAEYLARVVSPESLNAFRTLCREERCAPESVARILRVVKGPRLVVSEATEAMIDLNNQDDAPADADDREAPSEFQQVAVEFRRFAEQFHAFAVDVKRK